MRNAMIVAVAMLCGACSKPPTAMSVCEKLQAEGVAAACKEQPAQGLGARANDHAVFDLPSVPGKGGGIYVFEKAEDYEVTVKAFADMAMLAGSHRYGNEKRRVFVQLNEKAPLDVGKKTKALVEGL